MFGPWHQVIYGQKNRVFFRTYAGRGNYEELSKAIDKPNQAIAMRGRKRTINLFTYPLIPTIARPLMSLVRKIKNITKVGRTATTDMAKR